MYNQDIPAQNELPSTKKLTISTFIAAIFAGVILITSVLPAEYGIDPTGIGRALGFVEMAEIKSLLAEEKQADEQRDIALAESLNKEKIVPVNAPVIKQNPVEAITVKSDTKVFVLKPGQGAEIKLAMKKGELVDYQWLTKGGDLNFDTHGDRKGTPYHGYGKGRGVSSDQGVIKAAFDGSHGWFWRNRSKQDVEVTLTTQGQYENIKRVL